MKLVKRKLSELKAPEKNLRLHTDKQIAEFKRSVEMFGQIRPIVIDENNVMLAGNGLYETLTQLGWDEVSCYVASGLTDKQKKKLMLADNRIFDLGVDDMAAFDEFILDLQDDLDIPGFDEDMLKSFVIDASGADELIADYGTVPEDRAAEIKDAEQRNREIEDGHAGGMTEYAPGSVPEDIIKQIGNAAYKSEDGTKSYIMCPKCGERIWL